MAKDFSMTKWASPVYTQDIWPIFCFGPDFFNKSDYPPPYLGWIIRPWFSQRIYFWRRIYPSPFQPRDAQFAQEETLKLSHRIH
jgi:hypothetical protein